jgi:integral membrane protein
MPREPKLASFPAIRGALKFYQICSIITGIGLLLLVTEMIFKYTPLHLELFAGGSGGFLWLAPVIAGPDCQWWSLFAPMTNSCEMISTGDGLNISLFILVAHGWFYVVYLFSCFRMWSLMRWPFSRFILLALGGIVPLLSFFMEAKVAREVKAYLRSRETDPSRGTAAASDTPAPAIPTETPR